MQYPDVVTDKNILEYQYLPYLENINKDYINQFNLIILKRRKGYYEDQINTSNYDNENNRYINQNDINQILRSRYYDNDLLYDQLSFQLITMIDYYRSVLDFKNAELYDGYLYKVTNTLKNENEYLFKLIQINESNNNDEGANTINIYHIIYILIFATFTFLYFYTLSKKY